MGRESYDLIFEFSREERDIFATLHMSQTCFRKKISQFVARLAYTRSAATVSLATNRSVPPTCLSV